MNSLSKNVRDKLRMPELLKKSYQLEICPKKIKFIPIKRLRKRGRLENLDGDNKKKFESLE